MNDSELYGKAAPRRDTRPAAGFFLSVLIMIIVDPFRVKTIETPIGCPSAHLFRDGTKTLPYRSNIISLRRASILGICFMSFS